MRKIPTLFERDPDDRRRVLHEVTPGCEWVLAGEGIATRKYDGTCVMLDADATWLARREVKAGKEPPPHFRPIATDATTGRTVGWEPIERSPFARFHAEALVGFIRVDPLTGIEVPPLAGTYELVGPRINGNPERYASHTLVRHLGAQRCVDAPRDHAGLREWLLGHHFEGIVWHHPDGRMAKLKRRDFR